MSANVEIVITDPSDGDTVLGPVIASGTVDIGLARNVTITGFLMGAWGGMERAGPVTATGPSDTWTLTFSGDEVIGPASLSVRGAFNQSGVAHSGVDEISIDVYPDFVLEAIKKAARKKTAKKSSGKKKK